MKVGGAQITLKARAVRWLSLREHSRKELERKLAAYSQDPQEVENVLMDLEKEGWQSDQRFVEAFESSKSQRHGSRLIADSLRERGIDEHLIRESMQRLKESEEQRAWQVWQKKFASTGMPSDAKEYARQARFLASRGFDAAVVRKVLSGKFQPDDIGL